jgi:hypothetical protein
MEFVKVNNITLDFCLEKCYIIQYRNTSAEVLLNKMWEKVECLLERMVFPRYHEGPPARSNKHFYLTNIMKKIKGIIYKVVNIVNGHVYIGLTTRKLEIRKNCHLSDARRKANTYFHRALSKYGFEKFIWKIIDRADNINELKRLERFYIKKYSTKYKLYNMTSGGDGMFGASKTVRKKISDSKIGSKNPMYHIGKNHPNYGKKFNQELVNKLSIWDKLLGIKEFL